MLEQTSLNKIHRLLDKEFIMKFLAKRVLPYYPELKSIKKIEINPIKKHIWHTTYHVVIEYDVTFSENNGSIKNLPIFCTAHSNDPRKSVHIVLKYLWKNSFSKGYLTIPHPLFYSNFYKATFYRGVKGNNLLYYIKQNDYKEILYIVEKTAGWLAKLHSLDASQAENFNEKHNRIETAIPGKKRVVEKLGLEFPAYLDIFNKIYEELVSREKKFLKSTSKRWIIHGDAHPENVIKMGRKKIAMIDFTDVCLSDFARDIGTFMQQMDYMCRKKIDDVKFKKKINQIFLNSYCKYSRIKLTKQLKDRIDTYYYWTAFRTATFFLLKHNPDLERTDELLGLIREKFNIAN